MAEANTPSGVPAVTAGIKLVATDLVTSEVLTSAFDVPPVKLDTAELPALYPFTGQSRLLKQTSLGFGTDSVAVQRVFRVQVAVMPVGNGDPQQRETICRPLLDTVFLKFWQHSSLKQAVGVLESEPLGDSGVVLLPEWGGAFIGFEIRLQVTYLETQTKED